MPLTPSIATDLPAGTKKNPRVDFRIDEWRRAIKTKGYRMLWSRAMICSCVNNEQTDQPDPNCSICRGKAQFWINPDPAIRAGSVVDAYGNSVQLSDNEEGVIIQGIMTSVDKDVQINEKFGEWVFGTSRITTLPENRLGYRDRLILIDSEMAWTQLVHYSGNPLIGVVGGYQKDGLRYPVVEVLYLTMKGANGKLFVFEPEVDYTITSIGEIQMLNNIPPEDTLLSLSATIRPVYLCLEHIHSIRDSLVARKAAVQTTAGEFSKQPVQALCRLDFLVEQTSDSSILQNFNGTP